MLGCSQPRVLPLASTATTEKARATVPKLGFLSLLLLFFNYLVSWAWRLGAPAQPQAPFRAHEPPMKYVMGSTSSEAGEEVAGCQVRGTRGPSCALPGTATLLQGFSCHGHKYLHSFFFFFLLLFFY